MGDFPQQIVDEPIEFDDKNCSQKDSIHKSFQVKTSVLTMLTIVILSQVWEQLSSDQP